MLCISSSLQAQTGADDPAYQIAIDQAVQEFGLGNWLEAGAQFRRAHGIYASARTHRGIGMCSFELRKYLDARAHLREALTHVERPLTAVQRTEAEALIQRTLAYLGLFTLKMIPADAQVAIDGSPAVVADDGKVWLQLGDHVITAQANGHNAYTKQFTVNGGEDQELVIELQPTLGAEAAVVAAPAAGPAAPAEETQAQPESWADKADGGTPWAWIALGVGVVAAGAGVAFKLMGDSEYDKLTADDGCSPTCTQTEKDDSGVATMDAAMVGSFVVAGALLTTAIIMLSGDSDSGETAGTTFRVGPTGGSMEVRF